MLVLAQPLLLGAHDGQVDLAMLALMVWAHRLAKGHRPRRAGTCLALAVLPKPPALFFELLWLRPLRLRALFSLLGMGAAAFIPLTLRYGLADTVEQTRAWLALVEATTRPWAMGHNPQGMPTLLLELAGAVEPPSAEALRSAQGAAWLFLGSVLLLCRPRGRVALGMVGLLLFGLAGWRAWQERCAERAPYQANAAPTPSPAATTPADSAPTRRMRRLESSDSNSA